MKILLSIASLVFCFTAALAQNYSIRGTINAEANGKTIYLATRANGGWNKLDSAVVEGGQFVIDKGSVNEPRVAYLVVFDADGEKHNDFVLENAILPVNAKLGTELDLLVMGTKANNGYMEFKEFQNDYMRKFAPIRQQLEQPDITKDKSDSIKQVWYQMIDQYRANQNKVLRRNMDNYTGLYLLDRQYQSFELDSTKALLANVPEELHNLALYKKINGYVETMERTGVGKQYIDFEGTTPEGKTIKLSDYVGKNELVLIDFWASWCGPCMMEVPNVAKAYEKYKSKGLEIVGVTCDRNNNDWKKALKEKNMVWVQMSDMKNNKSEAVQKYGITGIPATVLLDKNGKIIARNLRGEELINKIAEFLK